MSWDKQSESGQCKVGIVCNVGIFVKWISKYINVWYTNDLKYAIVPSQFEFKLIVEIDILEVSFYC